VVSLPENSAELKTILDQLDEILLDQALERARKVYQKVLMEIDKTLAEHRLPVCTLST